MDLYLLRHAIAVTRGTGGYHNDADRPLTEKGAGKMRRIAKAMNVLGLSFDVILSSPILRARSTAEIVGEELGLRSKLVFSDTLGSDGDPEAVVAELIESYGSCGSILLVGHEPDMSELISLLLSGGTEVAVTMKKGGLCKLAVDSLSAGRCATLEWLLTPRQLIGLS
jgi:phosphohistidine phosphatase